MGILAVLLVLGFALDAAAGSVPKSVVGRRVRVTTLESSAGESTGAVAPVVEGRVIGIEEESLIIQPTNSAVGSGVAGPQRVSWNDVSRLDARWERKQSMKEGFWAGATALGLVGGALGGYVGYEACGFGEETCSPADKVGSGLFLGGATAVAGGLVGGAVGALLGAIPAANEWKTLHETRTKASLALVPQRDGMSASLSVRF
jgi:hypothetical protein